MYTMYTQKYRNKERQVLLMKKYILYLSSDEVQELKDALRDKARVYSFSNSMALLEKANTIDDILNKIYEQEDE